MYLPQGDVKTVAALQRVKGEGRLAIVARDGRSVLGRLYQDGAAKIRLPARDDGRCEAVLLNTAGGLTAGDRIGWRVEAGAGTGVTVTTQACERVYRCLGGHAASAVNLGVGAGASLFWLPQETILFDRCDFRRSIEVEMEEGARCLMVEATIFGRRAMGEVVREGRFRDRWRVRRKGRLVHAEDVRIEGPIAERLAAVATLGGNGAMATVLLAGPDAHDLLAPARALAQPCCAVSALEIGGTGKLLARIVAPDGYALRARLLPILRLLAAQAGLPKLWSL